MPIVMLIAAVAAVVWSSIYCRRGSLVLGGLAVLLAGYVAGHAVWNFDIGPLPLTIERIILVVVLFGYVVQRRSGRLPRTSVGGVDWILLGLLALLGVSLVCNPLPPWVVRGGSPSGRLLVCFLIPAAAYWVARSSRVTQREWTCVAAGIAALGVYLSLTALAEVGQQWWAVFPKYIADPKLGSHFGRARGPALNSASLGIYLAVAFACTWILCRQWGGRWRLLPIVLLPLYIAAAYATYTRSAWLGMALCVLVYLLVELRGVWRPLVITGLMFSCLIVLGLKWESFTNLSREGTVGSSRHSMQQRASFLYVSWQMFKDHPILGVGFGRFFDRKLPYLADRRQVVELESLRELQHHNTFLSLLTETGMIGLALFVGLLIAWSRATLSLVRNSRLPDWVRAQGILMLTVFAVYLSSAMFHDLTQQPGEQVLLFFVAGLTVGLAQAAATRVAVQPGVRPAVAVDRSVPPTTRSVVERYGRFGLQA